MNWAGRSLCSPHDHGSSFGWVQVVDGRPSHVLYTLDHRGVPLEFGRQEERTGAVFFAPRGFVHAMGNPTDARTVTFHVYTPPITGMHVYDLERCRMCVVSDDCGAWWPAEDRQRLKTIQLGAAGEPPGR
jgi:cysteine dioxygenase